MLSNFCSWFCGDFGLFVCLFSTTNIWRRGDGLLCSLWFSAVYVFSTPLHLPHPALLTKYGSVLQTGVPTNDSRASESLHLRSYWWGSKDLVL